MASVKWTDEQQAAIDKKGSNILVAAAAGSGKTAVLVERIIKKIIVDRVDIDKILVVTFTNAAASEMRERILEAIYKKIEENPEDANLQKQIILLNKSSICTIDSFCLDVIRNNFYEIDISANARVADSTEMLLLKQEVLDDMFEDKYISGDKDFLDLIDTYTKYNKDEDLKELILKIYTYIQASPFPEEWLNEKVEMGTQLDEYLTNAIEKAKADGTDPDRVKFVEEEILLPLRQRLLDFEQMLAVNQQGIVAMEIIRRNNLELIRSVERAKTVTVSALRVAVTVASALYHQKIVLEKVNLLNETTNNMIAATSKMLKDQGAEIQKQAIESNISIDTMKQAFADTFAALEDISNYKQEALPRVRQTIDEFKALTEEGEKALQRIEKVY